MTTVLDTECLEHPDRFEAYREMVSKTFVPLAPLAPTSTDGFACRLDSHEVGSVQISTIRATPHAVVRTSAAARHGDEAYFKLGLQMSGHARLDQDGRQAELGPGDLAIYDTTRPYRLEFLSDYRIMVVMFPQSLLRIPRRRIEEITARAVSGRTGLGALLSPVLAGLETDVDTGATAGAHLSDAVIDLIAACFARDEHIGPPSARRDQLMTAIVAYIEANLSDPTLDVASIAAAHHISASYLQKLFAGQSMSVAAFIRERRLERCRRDLANPSNGLRSAASIAAQWGFQDPSHFSRLFRGTFGMTPGECRVASLP
jgi:AraC-like DNA-binding protein